MSIRTFDIRRVVQTTKTLPPVYMHLSSECVLLINTIFTDKQTKQTITTYNAEFIGDGCKKSRGLTEKCVLSHLSFSMLMRH